MLKLILSSSSPARKELLSRLRIPFEIVIPDVDETPLPEESPTALVARLAVIKAMAHSKRFPNALIIGCDQVAVIKNKIVGKPLTHENAVKILTKASGQEITFHTALCLYNTHSGRVQTAVEDYAVVYRKLTPAMIENYLRSEQPYQCAGSIKVEGLGIALLQELKGLDPSTLTGLPLIKLIDMLQLEGVDVLQMAN